MQKRLFAWLISLCFLLGCLNQLTEEQKYTQNHNISDGASKCLDGDGKVSVEEANYISTIESLPHEYQDKLATAYNCDMVKIGAVAAYKGKPFFDDMMNTGSLEYFDTYVKINNHYPSLAEQMAKEGGPTSEYNEALGYGLDTVAAFELSHKQLSAEKMDVYKNIALFDAQTQIEAAKAYGVNLKFNELNFLAKDLDIANKVLQGGYSDIEDNYVEGAMKAFGEDLTKYLIKGAMKDDGIITNKDLDGLNWFVVEYPKMSPAMRNYFDSTWHPEIGTVNSIYFTDAFVSDPRAVASAPEEAKHIIPKEGYKAVVEVLNPGDYTQDGKRYIHIDTYAEKEAEKNGQNPRDFYVTNPISSRTWFFDDYLILGPNDLPTESIDHAIREVDSRKFWVPSGIFVQSGNSETNLWTGWGDYYYYYGNKMDIGANRLVDLVCDGYSQLQHDPNNIIYIGNEKYDVRVLNPRKTVHIVNSGKTYDYKLDFFGPLGTNVHYDENGNLKQIFYAQGRQNLKELYEAGHKFIKKAFPWLKAQKKKFKPI